VRVGALLAVPILFRHRWPLQVLIASAVVMFFYYIFARRNISPAPVFFVPLYDAAVVGYLALAIAIPAVFMVIGLFVVEVSVRQGIAALTAEFLSQIRGPHQQTADTLMTWTELQKTLEATAEGLKTP